MKGQFNRRSFLQMGTALLLPIKFQPPISIYTVNGKIPIQEIGTTLIHEHFLVDFIGADKINSNRWDRKDVVAKILPLLLQAREMGVKTIWEFESLGV